MTIFNVISICNSNVPEYNVILTSSNKGNYFDQINNVIVM